MTTPPFTDLDLSPEAAPAKPVWTRPTLDVSDIETSTRAGAGTIGDLDSNDPS